MTWWILFFAGLCEIIWALGLKFSHGLTKPLESVVTVFFMIVSLYLLAIATREIPIGISYIVWVGIGALGAFIGSVIFFQEKVSMMQVLFFSMIILGIVGLKFSSLKG